MALNTDWFRKSITLEKRRNIFQDIFMEMIRGMYTED